MASLALALAGCEADPIAARATLHDWGYRGIAIEAAPIVGRPCRWSEPYAVRFLAHDEAGRTITGTVCSADETTDDGRILVDGGER